MFGTKPELFLIGEGEESRAFAFDLGEDAYVLRINMTADGFAKDSYAGSRFAGPALPVPPVVDIGTLDDGHAYCVSRRAPGVTLQDLPASDLPGIVEPVCAVMDAIAACGVDGTPGFRSLRRHGSGHLRELARISGRHRRGAAPPGPPPPRPTSRWAGGATKNTTTPTPPPPNTIF
ncbi:hypothetical protein AB4144_44090, partial [Rhizobiaceae sp. 2RAB30]